MKKLFLSLLILLISFHLIAQEYQPNWESIDSRPVPQWFEDVKFGIFIHWGVYAVPAWAPADADIGIYAKSSEWYWWRKNENSDAGKLFRDYHNQMYGENFKYQDFAPLWKAQHFEPGHWADVFKKAGAKYVGPFSFQLEKLSGTDLSNVTNNIHPGELPLALELATISKLHKNGYLIDA